MKPASALPQYLQEVLATGAERVSGLLCPKCEGGRSHERSLGMYRFDTYVAVKCRRLKCGYSERFALVGVDVTTWNTPARVTRSREFYGALRAPSLASQRYIESRYGIRPHTLQLFGVKEVVGLKALYMPVWSPLAEKRGATVRRFDGWGRKADSFKHDESQPWQSWYLADYPRALVIVEDQLSAMRCWQLGYDAVALLGVALTQDRAAEIERNRRSRVLLALDADAFGTAMQQLRRYPWISRAVLLRDDLKDVSDEEIEQRLEGANGMKRNMPRPPEIMRKGSAHSNKRRMTGREAVDMDDIWDDLGEDYDPSPNCDCGYVWCGKCYPIAENE